MTLDEPKILYNVATGLHCTIITDSDARRVLGESNQGNVLVFDNRVDFLIYQKIEAKRSKI